VPDKKLTELAAITTPSDDDLIYIVDPTSSPVSQKLTLAQLRTFIGPWVSVSLGGSRAASLPLAAATYDLVNAEPAFTVPTLSAVMLATARIVADCKSSDPSVNITPRLINVTSSVVAGTGSACTASADDYTGTNQHQTVSVTVVSGQTYKAQAVVAGSGAGSNATFCTIRLEIG
jgi:hypothetical protein